MPETVDSVEIAKSDVGQVPALRTDTSRVLTAADIAFPRLYLAQGISNAVQDGNVAIGDFFIAQDGDDPDPEVVLPHDSDSELLFHVLDVRKGISRTNDEGGLDTWAFDDPDAPAPSFQTGAWTTYTYHLAIADVDEDLPIKFLLSRSGEPAAKKINSVLQRLDADQPLSTPAFGLSQAERTNKAKQRYRVARIRPVEPTDKSAAIAAKLTVLVEAARAKFNEQTASNDPAI